MKCYIEEHKLKLCKLKEGNGSGFIIPHHNLPTMLKFLSINLHTAIGKDFMSNYSLPSKSKILNS